MFVALGGALGAVARYAISLIPVKTGFPVLTFITKQQQLEVLNRLGELIRDLPTDRQLVNYIDQVEDIHIRHEEKWMKQLTFEAEKMQADLENRSKTMEKEFQSQVGKLNDQYATGLAKTRDTLKREMQEYSDKLYHRLLLPCLLMTLLVLLEICKV